MRVWEDLLSEHDRRVMANRLHFTQNRELGTRPALLVIDMQLGFVGEDRPVYEQQERYPAGCGNFAWAAIRHLQKLLPTARAAGIPVVYARFLVRPESGLVIRSAPNSPSRPEAPESQIIREIAPVDGDMVIEKTRASIFFGTPALYSLYGKNIDTLLVTGDSTSGCVRATVVDAVGYNFKVAVIEECVFDRLEISHKASLFDLWMKYCDVLSIDETYQYMDKVKKSR